jgi:hypothetical protein
MTKMTTLIITLGLAIAAVPCFAEANSPAPANPDCQLSGKGNVYVFDAVAKKYQLDQKDSYELSAIRFPVGNGKYLFVETKTYADGRPKEKTTFVQGMATGSFDFSAPDGTLISRVICTRPGHCAGTLILTSPSFTGHMATDFDSSGIRTLTFDASGGFSDETLSTPVPCEYK